MKLARKLTSHCLILKSLKASELTDIIWCDSCLLRFHPILHSHCPTDRTPFLFYLSCNAFREIIEIDDPIWSIRLNLTCYTPSASSKSHTIVQLGAHNSRFPIQFSNRGMGRQFFHRAIIKVNITFSEL